MRKSSIRKRGADLGLRFKVLLAVMAVAIAGLTVAAPAAEASFATSQPYSCQIYGEGYGCYFLDERGVWYFDYTEFSGATHVWVWYGQWYYLGNAINASLSGQ